MAGKKTVKSIVIMCAVLVLALCVAPAAAAQGAPQLVLDARDGVARIVVVVPEGFSMGTGFAIGTQDEAYIITNHHVVDVSDISNSEPEIRVYYQTGRYVRAEIMQQDPSRDLCVLKLTSTIPNLQTLPLQTNSFDVGIDVYALGYAASADQLSGDWDRYVQGNTDFAADKEQLTVTNGIVSALRASTNVGTEQRSVQVVQTNTAISEGNSGGPLLDAFGNVVGVNTLGMEGVQGMNGAVHVAELIDLLKHEGVGFGAAAQPNEEMQPIVPQQSSVPSSVWIIIAVVLVAVIVLLLVLRRPRSKGAKGNAVTLEAFEGGNHRLEEDAALAMMKNFVNELLPMAAYNINPLLTPTNILVGPSSLSLVRRSVKVKAGVPPQVFEGYCAPEMYQGVADSASTVYFIGAIWYTLTTGRRPLGAQARLQAGTAAFLTPNPAQRLINQMMEPQSHMRLQNLYQLREAMDALNTAQM